MSLATDYQQQFDWRAWPTVFEALPSVAGQTLLDLGCGVGDQAAEFVARGAHVIGIDLNEELLTEARARDLGAAEFRNCDLRMLSDLGVRADGIWCSFTAAYFPNLSPMLVSWGRHLRKGGWMALTEIDDLFGHEPLSARSRALFEAYAWKALAAGRYDFHMGRKLRIHLEQAGFAVTKVLTVRDQELSFDGPARPGVLQAWRSRLERMKLLRDFCGPESEKAREEFLACLARTDHRSTAKVYCCIAAR